MDRSRADRRYYLAEGDRAARLTDRDRTDQMRELYLLYLAFQETKSPEQIEREVAAAHRLERVKLNPRYRALLEEAEGPGEGEDDAPDAG